MELDKIKQVIDTHNKGTVNKLLEEGWILLDAKVVQIGSTEGMRKGGAYYILGRTQKTS